MALLVVWPFEVYVVLEKEWQCCGRHRGLKYAQATSSETVQFLLPLDQDVANTMSVCTPRVPP